MLFIPVLSTLLTIYSHPVPRPQVTILTFFQLQLAKITARSEPHAPGPKKPSLTQTDLERIK